MNRVLSAPDAFVFLAILIAVGIRVLSADLIYPSADALRYIAMGLNLHDFGVLTGAPYVPGQMPAPGLGAGGPWMAGELALAMWLDGGTLETFRCIALRAGAPGCDLDLGGLRALHVIEISLFLLGVWAVGRLVFEDRVRAGLAVLAVYLCRETFAYAGLALGEVPYLMLLGFFFPLWLAALRDRSGAFGLWVVVGAVLGLLVLVKPVALAVAPVAAGMLAILFLRGVLRGWAIGMAGFGFLVVVGVWLARTYLAVGTLGFSDPAYFAAAFAHRAAYNMMSWGEWLAGWIYYLPDSGDNLARDLFGAGWVAKLGWDANSYYVYGRDVLDLMAKASAQPATTYLLDGYVWADPIKHMAVSALLFWRGLFVGGLWAFVALIVAGVAFWRGSISLRKDLALLAVPAVAVAAAAALVSVNIPRYNLALIPFYAIALAWILGLGWDRISRTWLAARKT